MIGSETPPPPPVALLGCGKPFCAVFRHTLAFEGGKQSRAGCMMYLPLGTGMGCNRPGRVQRLGELSGRLEQLESQVF